MMDLCDISTDIANEFLQDMQPYSCTLHPQDSERRYTKYASTSYREKVQFTPY